MMKKTVGFGLAALLSLAAPALACHEELEVSPEQRPTQPAVETVQAFMRVSPIVNGEGFIPGSIKAALTRMPGVKHVEVKDDNGRVSVRFNPAKVKKAQLVKAVQALGYKVTLV